MFCIKIAILIPMLEIFHLASTDFADFVQENLALNQVTTQSSNLNCSSSQAVSGNREDFSCTEPESFNWWSVNFGSQKNVTFIKVYSHEGFAASSTQKVSIKTTRYALPGEPTSLNAKWANAINFQYFTNELEIVYRPATLLQHIAVTSEVRKPLTIDDVEVYAWIPLKKLALNWITSQSSTLNCFSSLAISENLDEFSCTKPEDFNWWMVSLGSQRNVAVIKAYSRKGFGSLTQKVSIKTTEVALAGEPTYLNANWTNALSLQRFTNNLVKLYRLVVLLRHIAVTSEVDKPLTINEMEVYAHAETYNVARGKPAVHSANANPVKALAHEAVNGMFDDFASPATGQDSYWQVDLEAFYTIEIIRIHNGANYSLLHDPTVLLEVVFKLVDSGGWIPVKQIKQDFHIEEIAVKTHIKLLAIGNVDTKTHMRLAEVEMFVERNLAFGKPASISSADGESMAEKAVNGYNGDFTKAENQGLKWWSVDLRDVYSVGGIKIRHVDKYYTRKLNYTVLTAKLSQLWIIRNASWKGEEKLETFTIMSTREVRYINITLNETGNALYFAEIVVHEYNFALGHTNVTQKSTRLFNIRELGPQKAVDNSAETFAITNYYIEDEQWWSVQLEKLTMMTSVEIFHHKGVYRQSKHNERRGKDDYYTAIQIKTSSNDFPPTVSLSHDDNWTVCLTQSVGLPLQVQHLECDENYRRPFVRHLSLITLLEQDRLVLEEVAIYGRELPEFSPVATASVALKKYSSFRLAFKVWSNILTGALPPTSYAVQVNGSVKLKTFNHAKFKKSGGIVAKFNNLTVGTVYSYTITCRIRGFQCPGKVVTGIVETQACTAPEIPAIHWRIKDSTNIKTLKVNVKETLPNCNLVKYRVELLKNGKLYYRQKGQSHAIHDIELNTYYKIIARVTNDENLTSSSYEELIAGEGVPDRPVLQSSHYNSSCVWLQVKNPSNYRFSMLMFKFSCSTGPLTKLDMVDGLEANRAAKLFCGFPQSTQILCTVVMENNIGESEALTVQGYTKYNLTTTIAAPSFPITTEQPIGNLGVQIVLPLLAGIAVTALAAWIVKSLSWPKLPQKWENCLHFNKEKGKETVQ